MWNVEIISVEAIKPSSPTPPHLSTLKLSLLGQLSPRMYVCLVLFYTTDGGIPAEKTQQLKGSLSETLVRFYPLAGRIEGNSHIDCNDSGVDFVEARVDGRLTEFLQSINMEAEAVIRLLPCDATCSRSGRDVLLAIQANVFECGGLAIGVGISHKITDGASVSTLLNGWAATTRRAHEVVIPTFDSAAHFPPGEVPLSTPGGDLEVDDSLVTKRFIFYGPKISKLRTRASNGMQIRCPTRVESVSVLIWQCIMRARGEVGSKKAWVALQTVNLRRRMVPPLPDHAVGNLFSTAILSIEAGECNGEMQQYYLEEQMRDAISKVDHDHVRRLQGPCGVQEYSHEQLRALGEKYSQCGMDVCIFSSWCRFPIYEADFGWGRPIWVSPCKNRLRNCSILMGTRSGDGMEAYICMDKEEMARFEHDQELLSFATIPTAGVL